MSDAGQVRTFEEMCQLLLELGTDIMAAQVLLKHGRTAVALGILVDAEDKIKPFAHTMLVIREELKNREQTKT